MEKLIVHNNKEHLIIIDKEYDKFYDDNEWVITLSNGSIKYIRNKKNKNLLHHIIFNSDGLSDLSNGVSFKNKKNYDFRKCNLELSLPNLKVDEKTKILLFIDTETTGIPQKTPYGKLYNPRNKDAYEYARLLSLSYMITDNMGNTILEPINLIIKPTNFVIPERIEKLTGITNVRAKKNGIYFKTAINKFESDIHKYKVSHFISHNVMFDKNIMMNSALRRNWINDKLLFHLENNIDYECTYKLSNYKNLEYCIKNILNEEPEYLHHSFNDMIYCMRLYFKLKNI